MKEKNQKNKKILFREIQMFFSKEKQYKEQIFVWIIADLIKVFGLCFVWMAASQFSNNASQDYVVTYYILLVLISKFTQDLTPEVGIRDIVLGRFSNFLLKPFNYLLEYLGGNIGNNILRAIIFIPACALGIYLTSTMGLWVVGFNMYHIVLCFGAIVIGFLINFLIGNIVSLISFYIKEMDGIRIFYYNIASLFSGEYIPFIFLPVWGQYILQLLPFRYTLSFPIEVLIGRLTEYDLLFGFGLAIVWLIVLFVVYKVLFKFAIKKYGAEGI